MNIIIYSKNPIVVNDELMERLKRLKKYKRLTKYVSLDEFGNVTTLANTIFIPQDFLDKHFTQEVKVIGR